MAAMRLRPCATSCKDALTMIKETLIDIEGRLKERGIPVRRFCAEVGINPSTWQRWKAGQVSPRLETWLRVQEMAPPKEKKGRAA